MTPTIRFEPHKVSVPGLLLCLLMHWWLLKGRRCNLIYETDFQVGHRSWGLRIERGRDPSLQAFTTGATIINPLYCAATPQLAALPLTDGFMLPSSSPHTLYCQHTSRTVQQEVLDSFLTWQMDGLWDGLGYKQSYQSYMQTSLTRLVCSKAYPINHF